ncbi:hypothetical protein G1K66_08455 [Tenacibaculum finnmarkense]|uniref:Uncharacterized protein n=1 Tax=Tenacibaculum finnmarkense genomovar ulcerans TaxID=2781388 RepID=A0A2I2MA85_9FLAO|nr:hypothetical protein [Tenacibaculum finnmarkense]MCG8813291.1 hypothetical protein [Tenacibaculum finnmarkense]SOU89463.1 hypothetical protein TNO010_400038 [Tenacibaculum finnmarkense genomovar ulcerans]
MEGLIEKYEAKLQFITKSLEQTKHLMDSDLLEIMEGIKSLVSEMVDDLKKEAE